MAPTVIAIGDKFDSFVQVKNRITAVENSQYLSRYKRDSRRIEVAKKKDLN